MEKTINLIRKLLAHADSARAIGSLEEAAAFAEKANNLLLEHKLGMTDLEIEAEDDADPVGSEYYNVGAEVGGKMNTKRRTPWLSMLGNALCKAHFCRMLTVAGSKTVRIVGRKTDRDIVKYLYKTLSESAFRLGIAYEKKVRYQVGGVGVPPKLANDFRVGFIVAVVERLKTLREEVEVQGGQFAITRFHNADNAVTKFIEERELAGKTSAIKIDAGNMSAFAAGKAAGERALLHGGIGGGTRREGTLGKGQNLLKGGGK